MSTISHEIPTLTPEHISGYRDSKSTSTSTPQTVRIPDLYQKFGSRTVRYRIRIDHAYLGQSSAVAEIWSHHGVGWVELAEIFVAKEFYTVSPPKSALDPQSRELAKYLSSDRAELAAGSWQKVVNRLAEESQQVLHSLGILP